MKIVCNEVGVSKNDWAVPLCFVWWKATNGIVLTITFLCFFVLLTIWRLDCPECIAEMKQELGIV
jgi:hypothetical protein